jgi:hypothetical protein
MQFINGKAEIKHGRKIAAKIYHRPTYYQVHNIKATFAPGLPYCLEIKGMARECETLDKAIFYLNKYL